MPEPHPIWVRPFSRRPYSLVTHSRVANRAAHNQATHSQVANRAAHSSDRGGYRWIQVLFLAREET